MVGANTVRRQAQRVNLAFRNTGDQRVNLGGGEAQAARVNLQTVEFFGQFDQRGITTCPYFRDYSGNDAVHIRAVLAFGVQQSCEVFLEPRIGSI